MRRIIKSEKVENGTYINLHATSMIKRCGRIVAGDISIHLLIVFEPFDRVYLIVFGRCHRTVQPERITTENVAWRGNSDTISGACKRTSIVKMAVKIK